jgi:hypothetical protein
MCFFLSESREGFCVGSFCHGNEDMSLLVWLVAASIPSDNSSLQSSAPICNIFWSVSQQWFWHAPVGAAEVHSWVTV